MAPATKAAPNATAVCKRFKAGNGLVADVYDGAASVSSSVIDQCTTEALRQAGIPGYFQKEAARYLLGGL
jgi:hypothetical protein